MTTGAAAAHTLLRRDRAVVLVAVAAAAALAWTYLLLGAAMEMPMRDAMAPAPWTRGTFAVMVVMWAAMMVAMMLPSAAPMILLFATIANRGGVAAESWRATALFALAYIIVWTVFSVAATAAQWALEGGRLLTPEMRTGSALLAGALFVAGGAWQLTPLKQACLRQCRSPLEFLTQHWVPGPGGAFRMGLRHGLVCVGCCWAMMALLFVGGLMNLLWVAALALFVLFEKIAPTGRIAGRVAGVSLVLWGCTTIALAVLA